MIDDLLLIFAGIALLGLLVLACAVFSIVLNARHRLLRRKVVVCPEDGRRALVEIDPGPPVFGAISNFLKHKIFHCSLWNGKRGCGGRCTDDEESKSRGK